MRVQQCKDVFRRTLPTTSSSSSSPSSGPWAWPVWSAGATTNDLVRVVSEKKGLAPKVCQGDNSVRTTRRGKRATGTDEDEVVLVGSLGAATDNLDVLEEGEGLSVLSGGEEDGDWQWRERARSARGVAPRAGRQAAHGEGAS